MQQQIVESVRGKNKATDLKKLIQQACNPQKSRKPEPLAAPFMEKFKDKPDPLLTKSKCSVDSNKSIKSIKSITLANKLKGKPLNVSTGTVRNKQNISGNVKEWSKKLTSSVVLKESGFNGLATDKSLKNIKVTSSVQLSKIMPKSSRSVKLDYDQKLRKAISDLSGKPRKKQPSIEDFDLGKKLGKGRFGNVYMAQEKHTKYTLAIKVINCTQLKQSEMEAQLLQEIKLQTYMSHPNILKMYGCIRDNKNIYLLLELGTGCLFKELRHRGHFNEAESAYYIKQVIESLKYMHSEGIIHRDIKPQNILLCQGVLKLSDFGWSTYSPYAKRQTFCGTLDYVPPEIVEGDLYDQRVDIWSLGVLCYELNTGKAPFEVPNNQQGTYDKICSAEVDYPSHMSAELKDLISRILTREPGQRLTLSQIESHTWLTRHSTVGRYISKEVWDSWQSLK